jgi:hypothetical protein
MPEPSPKADMNKDQSLRRLLDELQAADAARQGQPRDSRAYDEAASRVERLVKAVWREAGEKAELRAPEGDSAAADDSMDL